jgi:SAM-dependent methyltransferase
MQIPFVRDLAGRSVRFLRADQRGDLIDVGCGTGAFLHRMRAFGWKVLGIEPDDDAVEAAREVYGLPVIKGTMESAHLKPRSADAITLHHVIEHVPAPVETLAACAEALRPGGTLVLITPNPGSLAHGLFRSRWRGIEPPRHFQLFPIDTLCRCVERAGLDVAKAWTTASGARDLWFGSLQLTFGRPYRSALRNPVAFVSAWVFQLVEDLLTRQNCGEEDIVLAKRV